MELYISFSRLRTIIEIFGHDESNKLKITFLQILLFSMVILSKGQTYVQGNLMKVDRFNTYLIEVDIHSWPTGMYYYNVQLENGQILNGRFLRN